MSLYKHVRVEDALKEHAELIKTLREKCKDEIALDPQQFNEDLFLVRFCLSHKGEEEKAVNAVKAATNWRFKNKELLAKLATGWKHPDEDLVSKFFPLGTHGQAKDGSVIFVVRSGIGNLDGAMEHLHPETIKNAMVFSKERIWEKVHEETKARGYFVKMVTIQDFKHGSVFDFNRKFMGILGEASKEMELMYPQLLGAAVVVNPLSIIKAMMAVASLIMPASVIEKFRVCGAKSTVTGDISTCPVAPLVFDLNNFPSFLGGKCTCSDKGGCIGGIPNVRKERVQPSADILEECKRRNKEHDEKK